MARGVALASEAGIAAQCEKLADKAAAAAASLAEGQEVTKDGARGREATARGSVASGAIYPLRYQAPHSTSALHAALERIQIGMNKVTTGGFHGARRRARLQPKAEGGYGHMHIRRHLEATWHKKGLETACSADAGRARTSTPTMSGATCRRSGSAGQPWPPTSAPSARYASSRPGRSQG